MHPESDPELLTPDLGAAGCPGCRRAEPDERVAVHGRSSESSAGSRAQWQESAPGYRL